MKTIKLTEYDIKVLRVMNGEDLDDVRWGAAMGACLEYLSAIGYCSVVGQITERGKDFLKRLDGLE